MKPKHYKDIHGWFDFEGVYDDFASWIPDGGKFAQIGVWMGKSFCYFNEAIKIVGKTCETWAIGTFEGSPDSSVHPKIVQQRGGSVSGAFRQNMNKANIDCNTLAMKSVDACFLFDDNYFDCIFIDAAHDYKSVRDDIRCWLPKVKSGGILAGHDLHSGPGVRRAVTQKFGKQIKVLGNVWIYHKK